MTCAETVPAKKTRICDLLARHKVKLSVFEVKEYDGEWHWCTRTEPAISTYDPGCWAGGEGWVTCSGQGKTPLEAIERLCENLSGQHIHISAPRFFSLALDVDLTQTKVSP